MIFSHRKSRITVFLLFQGLLLELNLVLQVTPELLQCWNPIFWKTSSLRITSIISFFCSNQFANQLILPCDASKHIILEIQIEKIFRWGKKKKKNSSKNEFLCALVNRWLKDLNPLCCVYTLNKIFQMCRIFRGNEFFIFIFLWNIRCIWFVLFYELISFFSVWGLIWNFSS